MYATTWLLFIALPVTVCSVPQPTCVIPDGHTNGEFVSGTREPKGGRTCVVHDGFVETTVRRCETRYCCTNRCTCGGQIYESSSICDGHKSKKLSCFVEHKDYKFNKTVCCDEFEEDPNGICVGIGAPGPSKIQSRSSTTQFLIPSLPRKHPRSTSTQPGLSKTQSRSSTTQSLIPSLPRKHPRSTSTQPSKPLTTIANVTRTSERSAFVVAGHDRHDPEAKRSSSDHLGFYICLPLALLGLLIGALLFVYFRYRQRRKVQEAAVVFSTPGYDNTIYALPQPLHVDRRPYDGVSLPPPYEESPYETITDVREKKSGMPDDDDDDVAGAVGGSIDEKKVMSSGEEPQVYAEAVPCCKPGGY